MGGWRFMRRGGISLTMDCDPMPLAPLGRGNSRPVHSTICCVIDQHPRFYVELVLWTICAQRHLPTANAQIVVYFVGNPPSDIADWLRARGVKTRIIAPMVEGSPHCNKIAPFLDAHETDATVVTDADLFFVKDPSLFLGGPRFRAPPNNHANPPPHIFRSILAASGMGHAYKPGLALYANASGMRETHINNISGGIVAAPRNRSHQLATLWRKWALWLVDNRELMGRWAVHVDQVAFALTMEELGQSVEFLPPQTNTILHSLTQIANVYAFHLTTGHIPRFPERFNADRTLATNGVAPGVASAIGKLNECIREATTVISSLPSTKDHMEKFMNPKWKR